MMRQFYSLIFFLILTIAAFAQSYNYNLSGYYNRKVMLELNKSDSIVHSSFKPLRIDYTEQIINSENIFLNEDRNAFAEKLPVSIFWKKVFSEDFIIIDKENLKFTINPLLNYYKTNLYDDSLNYGQNTRAFQIFGTLGEKISFYTDFYENQAYYLPYVNDNVNNTLVAPGQGVWKPFGENKTGKDYNYATGYLSYSPFSYLNVQIGHSKHFIGAGYRSLLLSDNSAAYPFAKISFTKNKFQYNVMFTEFDDFKTKYYFYHYKKHGTFLYLNYSPVSNVELGFFEGIIWKTTDDSTYTKHFPTLFFVPVPGIRELVYGMNDENNILVGLNFRAKVYKYADVYSQFALDDFQKESFNQRYAFQGGFKIYDVFAEKIKKQTLFLQAEYNYSKPYTYTNSTAHSAYTNFNEPIASTLGSGFKEIVGILNWNLYGFNLNFKYNNFVTSTDTVGSNFGVNLLLSDNSANFKNTTNFVGQGNVTNISNISFTVAYIVNPVTNLQIFAEFTKRKFSDQINDNEIFFVSFGIKNAIKNFYTDY